jgi:hypothetical protein
MKAALCRNPDVVQQPRLPSSRTVVSCIYDLLAGISRFHHARIVMSTLRRISVEFNGDACSSCRVADGNVDASVDIQTVYCRMRRGRRPWIDPKRAICHGCRFVLDEAYSRRALHHDYVLFRYEDMTCTCLLMVAQWRVCSPCNTSYIPPLHS